jgi:hypothetical protein
MSWRRRGESREGWFAPCQSAARQSLSVFCSLELIGLLAALLCHACAQAATTNVATASAPKGAVATPAQSTAMKAHVDRLAILTQERNDLLSKLQKAEKDGDKDALTRTQADLQALDREIAQVTRGPVYEITRTAPAQSPTASAPLGAVNPAQPPASEVVTYESWDVFKNFGKKEPK